MVWRYYKRQMRTCQGGLTPNASWGLQTRRLGPLPLINHIISRLHLDERLERFVPTQDRRVRLAYAKGLGVLLRSILVEREPIYRQHETVATFAEEAFGLDAAQVNEVSDDAIGRALDRLFDADRAALLTDVVVAAAEEFGVALEELHNDSTSVRFCGQYPHARGRHLRGKRAPLITYGYSKDHRPDLKQLLFILTSSEDGGIPVQFRSEAGNTNDATTHEKKAGMRCAGRRAAPEERSTSRPISWNSPRERRASNCLNGLATRAIVSPRRASCLKTILDKSNSS